jgi:hypothetical protein
VEKGVRTPCLVARNLGCSSIQLDVIRISKTVREGEVYLHYNGQSALRDHHRHVVVFLVGDAFGVHGDVSIHCWTLAAFKEHTTHMIWALLPVIEMMQLGEFHHRSPLLWLALTPILLILMHFAVFVIIWVDIQIGEDIFHWYICTRASVSPFGWEDALFDIMEGDVMIERPIDLFISESPKSAKEV